MIGAHARAGLLGLDGHPWVSSPAEPDLTERLRGALHAATAPDVSDLPARRAVPALVELVEESVDRYRGFGLPDQVAVQTLADVGRKVRWYDGDIDTPWLLGLLRADVVGVGRLQAERVPGEHGRALHVPEAGPLAAAAVDEALTGLRRLLDDAPMTCTSWLLDRRVLELRPDSNLVRFRARFDIADGEPAPAEDDVTDGDRAVARFVFRRPVAEVRDRAEVHPSTSLERLVASTLRSGAHWTEPTGHLATLGC
ncbi:hypothetical protein [Isoptericola sp. NPDC057191]|uniref:hypothetical protein n=1 Tax=Isoptericola sp. NPDC057191 TaxID=3346041 RepID=UPI0036454527